MNKKTASQTVLFSTLVITLLILSLIVWSHFNGGVPSHHLLANKNLPEISNWWGLLLLPVATYLSLNKIKKRIDFEDLSNQNLKKEFLLPFFIALFYAITMAIAFQTGNSQISSFMFKAVFIIALFVPIYKAEYYLGFIFGLTFTFGGVLPILFGLFLIAISYLIYKYIRSFFIGIKNKIK